MRFRRRPARRRVSEDQRMAWHIQDILVGCGLFQSGASIIGGTHYYIPRVISKPTETPPGFNICIYPGQAPHHFRAHAQTIAHNLGVADIRIIPLEPYLIRLELVERIKPEPFEP